MSKRSRRGAPKAPKEPKESTEVAELPKGLRVFHERLSKDGAFVELAVGMEWTAEREGKEGESPVWKFTEDDDLAACRDAAQARSKKLQEEGWDMKEVKTEVEDDEDESFDEEEDSEEEEEEEGEDESAEEDGEEEKEPDAKRTKKDE